MVRRRVGAGGRVSSRPFSAARIVIAYAEVSSSPRCQKTLTLSRRTRTRRRPGHPSGRMGCDKSHRTPTCRGTARSESSRSHRRHRVAPVYTSRDLAKLAPASSSDLRFRSRCPSSCGSHKCYSAAAGRPLQGLARREYCRRPAVTFSHDCSFQHGRPQAFNPW